MWKKWTTLCGNGHTEMSFLLFFGGPPNECQASSHPNRDKKEKKKEPWTKAIKKRNDSCLVTQ